ncbi:carbohydrate esterase [Perilla frutescens var. frutescens]|nr:carbohydrate esterase [Perilla frutescens var. frutescens]
MAGRGGISYNKWDRVIPAEDKADPQILRFNSKLTWEEAHDPLHQDIDPKTCGVGPGMSFAKTILAKDPCIGVIGLVPCAIGGTKISEWARGSKLYNDMMKRTKAALKDGGTLRGLMWFQGESDTSDLHDAESYKIKFEQFIDDVRVELQMPTLPVVQVLVTSGDGPYVEKVRESQMAVKLPNFKSVDAWGLPLQGDNVHLTVDAQIKVGHMLAHAFLQFPSQ